MKLFGRSPERYIFGLKDLPLFLRASWRAFYVFEHPLKIIWLYLIRGTPSQGFVSLRSGHVIHMSGDPADIVTIFLIFAREDYGKIDLGINVVDIGANIGAFALFAAISGARNVFAFEPSANSYEILLKNIKANGFDTVICAQRRAVVGVPRGPVKFPRNSDVLNAILPDSSNSDEYDLVPSVALSEILSCSKTVDLLKSDCEGGEYDIFLNAGAADIQKISEIRMEYHNGPQDEMIARFQGLGYSVRQFMGEDAGGGCLWVKRCNTP